MKTDTPVRDEDEDGFAKVQKRICTISITLSVIIAILFLLLHERAIAKGVLLGTIFSIINFFLLGKSLPLVLMKTRSKASLIGLASMLTRFAVLAIPLVIGIKSTSFNFVAVTVGIFTVQIVLLIDNVIIRPFLGRKRGKLR